tara:strand:+ start:103 stop:702 length:600 start_codon:yes stop_codon:yes gene_type:complete
MKTLEKNEVRKIIENESYNSNISESLKYHINNRITIDKNIFRPGSKEFFKVFKEARRLTKIGKYYPTEEERFYIIETDIGEFGIYNESIVPLDFPILEETIIAEAKYKGKKVKLGKKGASRIGKGRARVYVRDPKTKKIKKVTFGSSMPDAMGKSEKAKKRRKSFGARHNCSDKKDKTKPGYWSCRLTKLFGRNIPGWW